MMPMPPPSADFPNAASITGREIFEQDWSLTSLGSMKGWPPSLRSTLALMLACPTPMFLAWGPELLCFYNDAYRPFLGYRLDAALGRPFREVWGSIWDDIGPLVAATLAGESRTMTDMPLNLSRRGVDEEGWWTFTYSPAFDDEGTIAGLFCVTSETTAQVVAERGLRDLAETLEEQVRERTAALLLYQNIVQSDQAPVCAFDRDCRLIAFNRAHSDDFHRIYGYRVQIGDDFPSLFLPDQGAVIRGFMERALAGESFTIVEEFGDPDREKPYWEVAYSPLRDEEGRIFGAFHHARDITDRVRAQAELQGAQEALRQSQKMEAVGQLTGGLAHDFNNLLTGVMGNLELLHLRITRGRTDDLERFITAAQGAGNRAASLTQRLLAFSRRQTLDPKPTDVNRLIAGIEELIRRTVGPEVQMEVVGAAGLWPAMVDASQLENALLNLCINARDAMPGGGRLTIETANKWMDGRAGRERDIAPGQYLSICVTDTGTGMTPETIERAFDPFFTTKPIGQGTGLGLSMIYGFAKQSGGQVRIYSQIGEGTTLCIYLPRHRGDVDSAIDAEGEDGTAILRAEGRETVLVVDDEPTIRHLIDEVLDEAGYHVIEAGDGAAGLTILESGTPVDLLITDVGLPNGMNGRQVADAARVLRPNLKVLFITGYAENAAVGNGHMEPGMELLTKPFSMTELAGRVHDMLGTNRTD